MGENEKARFRGAAGRGLGSLRRFLENEGARARGGEEKMDGADLSAASQSRRVAPRLLRKVTDDLVIFPATSRPERKKMPIRGGIRRGLVFLNRSRIATMNTRGSSFSRRRAYRIPRTVFSRAENNKRSSILVSLVFFFFFLYFRYTAVVEMRRDIPRVSPLLSSALDSQILSNYGFLI